MRWYFVPARISKFLSDYLPVCLWGCGERGTHAHIWWTCPVVQKFGMTIWHSFYFAPCSFRPIYIPWKKKRTAEWKILHTEDPSWLKALFPMDFWAHHIWIRSHIEASGSLTHQSADIVRRNSFIIYDTLGISQLTKSEIHNTAKNSFCMWNISLEIWYYWWVSVGTTTGSTLFFKVAH